MRVRPMLINGTVRLLTFSWRKPPDEVRAWKLFAAGDTVGAVTLANELIARAESGTCEAGFAGDYLHVGHSILGYVALERGDVDQAASHLVRSGQVEATPVLSSFGPDLGLAWGLLRAGRDAEVLTFLHSVAGFWSPETDGRPLRPPPPPRYSTPLPSHDTES